MQRIIRSVGFSVMFLSSIGFILLLCVVGDEAKERLIIRNYFPAFAGVFLFSTLLTCLLTGKGASAGKEDKKGETRSDSTTTSSNLPGGGPDAGGGYGGVSPGSGYNPDPDPDGE